MVQADPENYRALPGARTLPPPESTWRTPRTTSRSRSSSTPISRRPIWSTRSWPSGTRAGRGRQVLDRIGLPSCSDGIDVARQVLDRAGRHRTRPRSTWPAPSSRGKPGGSIGLSSCLENGVKAAPEQIALRLASRRDPGRARRHRQAAAAHRGAEGPRGQSDLIIDYLTAFYRYNNKEFEKAKQILTSIQAGVAQSPDLKAQVNVLLAQCHGQLHEPEKEWAARQRAFDANPKDITRKAGWINGLIRSACQSRRDRRGDQGVSAAARPDASDRPEAARESDADTEPAAPAGSARLA